jgi:MFS family permease
MAEGRPALVLAVVWLATLAITIDTTIMDITQPTVVRDMDASTRDLQWIVSGAQASSFGALGPIIGGWLRDHSWWGTRFLAMVPAAVLALLLASRAVPREPRSGHDTDVAQDVRRSDTRRNDTAAPRSTAMTRPTATSWSAWAPPETAVLELPGQKDPHGVGAMVFRRGMQNLHADYTQRLAGADVESSARPQSPARPAQGTSRGT